MRDVARGAQSHAAKFLGEIAVASLKSTVRAGMLMTWLRDILPDEIARVLPAHPWGPVTGSAGCGSLDQQGLLHVALGHAVIEAAALGRVRGNHTLVEDSAAEREILGAMVRGLSSLSGDMARRGEGLTRLAQVLREYSEPGRTPGAVGTV